MKPARCLGKMMLAACLGLPVAAHAQLTEAEKQLLMSGMSASSATEAGRAGDAAALERIVAIGDPALVRAFDHGMRHMRELETMPPAIEALVVKHFDHPKVGGALRTMQVRYRTRALFDLHYARVQQAYRSDEPSFGQILRTDQPGIDEPLLAIAARFPSPAGEPNPVALFAARRKHPGAVPLLIAELEGAYRDPKAARLHYNNILDLLVAYPSPEVWRLAAAQADRLRSAGRVSEEAHAAIHRKLDPLLANPDAEHARVKRREAQEAWVRKRDAVTPNASQIAPLKVTAPRRYVEEYAGYLERLEAAAADFRNEDVEYELGREYADLGLFTRFQVRDAALAVRFLEKAAKGRDLMGQVALADTYQLALRDKAQALRAYQLALATASEPKGARLITPYAPPGHPMNEFWKAWIEQEIAYLRTGTPFNGRVSETAIGGFWEVMGVWARLGTRTFPEWPVDHRQLELGGNARASPQGFGAAQGLVAEPPPETLDHKELAARLARVPASRVALMVTLRYISLLPDAGAILGELARSDPSGFWTTIALGTVAFHERGGESTRMAAELNGVADALPGMASQGRPNALAAAARRHLQARELRVVGKKP